MYGFSSLLVLATAASTALAQLNDTGEYRLKTEVKPHQRGKGLFNNLYLYSYHIGAGQGDATFASNSSSAVKGFLSATNTSTADAPDYRQEFDLGTDFPWSLIMAQSDTPYSGWQPVRLDAGIGGSVARGDSEGFFINSTGLQWSSAPGGEPESDSFGGFLVCDWWHGVPQLFFRLAYYDTLLPNSCAEVYLRPEYI